MLDGPLDCAGAVSCGRLNNPRPKLAELFLVAFERVSDISRVIGATLLIDNNRQIAAHPDSIHVVEEEKAIAAKQILHIVLGARNEDIDALVFEQGVESRRVEGRCSTRSADDSGSIPFRITISFLRLASRPASQFRSLGLGCLDQPPFERNGDGFSSSHSIHLGEDRFHVSFHGVFADVNDLSNLLVALAGCHVFQNLEFTFG